MATDEQAPVRVYVFPPEIAHAYTAKFGKHFNPFLLSPAEAEWLAHELEPVARDPRPCTGCDCPEYKCLGYSRMARPIKCCPDCRHPRKGSRQCLT